MSDLLLAEDLFLLAHDDDSGRANGLMSPDVSYSGALLLELAEDGLVRMDGKNLVAAAGTASHPLLAAAHNIVRDSDKPRTPDHWIHWVPVTLKKRDDEHGPIDERVGRSLVERGVLSEERGKMLKFFSITTWPEVDPAPERELRARLRAVLVDGGQPSPHDTLLIALLEGCGAIGRLYEDKQERKQAQHRSKEITEAAAKGSALSGAVNDSLQAVQVAVFTAIMPAMIATTIN